MDNKSAFSVNSYDQNVRKVIPLYDEIYLQIFSLIKTYSDNKPLDILDTGCGSGTFAVNAYNNLNISEVFLCDPSEKMLLEAKIKLKHKSCHFECIGSEHLAYENKFDVVTAIQSHHYFGKDRRTKAVKNCFNALKSGGIFIYFENTAPFSEVGKKIVLKRVEEYGLNAGRTLEEVHSHSLRYNHEYFPITISEHLTLLKEIGFQSAELFWHSYMQSGFYAIKP